LHDDVDAIAGRPYQLRFSTDADRWWIFCMLYDLSHPIEQLELKFVSVGRDRDLAAAETRQVGFRKVMWLTQRRALL
jgi:hypothetical protein